MLPDLLSFAMFVPCCIAVRRPSMAGAAVLNLPYSAAGFFSARSPIQASIASPTKGKAMT